MNLGENPVHHLPLTVKLRRIHWSFLLLLCVVAAIGAAMLYSAANGSVEPWAVRHCARFAMGLGLLIVVALTDVRVWLRYAYAFYALALVLLAAVEVAGSIGMGAQRWIDLGIIKLQPSEVMKVALVMALARYFHGVGTDEIGRPLKLIPPLILVAAPSALVLKQPDLGTALMLLSSSGVVFFVAGVRLWMFAVVAGAGMAAAPVAREFLHDYQRQRVLTFLEPASDPSAPATISSSRRLPWARAASSVRASCLGARATSTSCPKSRPTSSSPCSPRRWGWSAPPPWSCSTA